MEIVGDGLSVSEMAKLMDQILGCMFESHGGPRIEGFDDDATEPIRRSLSTLIEDSRWAALEGTLELAVLAHKATLVFVSTSRSGRDQMAVAERFNARAIDVLRRQHAAEASQWRSQAEAIRDAALRDGGVAPMMRIVEHLASRK